MTYERDYTISDKDFFTGFSGGQIPWKAWMAPGGFWIAFSLVFFFVFTCWSVILRRQWVERERYVFPLVQVPLHLVKPSSMFEGKFLRNRLLWIGISIAFLAHLLNGLNRYFPAVPHFQLSYSLAPLFTEKPWNALVQMRLQTALYRRAFFCLPDSIRSGKLSHRSGYNLNSDNADLKEEIR